jgi:fatty acid desaturase
MINLEEIDQNLDKNNYFFKIRDKISFDDPNIKNYEDLKKNLKINYYLVYLQTLLPLFILGLTCAISIIINSLTINKFYIYFFHSLFLSIIIGLIFHNMQNCIHGGVHYNLHPNKNISELIANTLGLFTGCEVKEARKIHLKHHTLNGTVDDPENSYLYPLTIKKIIFYFTGLAIIEYALNYAQKKSNNLQISFFKRVTMLFTPHRTASLLMHVIFLSIFYFYFKNLVLVFSWIAAYFIFFPFFKSLLNILEHAEDKKIRISNNYKLKPINRNFGNDFFSKYVYGNCGSNMHALHHWDATIHYTQLEKINELLKKSDISNSIKKRDDTYLKTLNRITRVDC